VLIDNLTPDQWSVSSARSSSKPRPPPVAEFAAELRNWP
jgi:hypothetical protein